MGTQKRLIKTKIAISEITLQPEVNYEKNYEKKKETWKYCGTTAANRSLFIYWWTY